MRVFGTRLFVPIGAALLLLAHTAGAQVPDEFNPDPSPDPGKTTFTSDGAEQPDSFGLHQQWTVYHVSQWVTWDGTATPDYAPGTGYIFPAGGTNGKYWRQIDLPAGASIDAICWLYADSNAAGEWDLVFAAYESAYSGSTPYYMEINRYESGLSATPGYDVECRYLNPHFVVRNHGDLNSADGNHYLSHLLFAYTTGSTGSSLSLFGAVARWSRIISPAPTTATFGDVPTSHWAFQHIEALVDSGITAGCGGGDFCPDAPLTRAQMAVFLAKALGLHFPI